MRHRRPGASGAEADGFSAGHHPHRHGHRRQFDYGELRLLVLAMVADRPRHGYELMKALEDRFGGHYSPSPGVMYPTLSWLADMGYVVPEAEAEAAGRKRYRVTGDGAAFLQANRAAAEELLSRPGRTPTDGGAEPPPAVLRAMENLKLAIRLRLRRGAIDGNTTEGVAAALDAAAQLVERS